MASSADLREQLQSTLGTAYALERELGGGGMSRVFVAHDARLGRRVVVKVLHPELAAGLSAARFEREVRLAARLQHPHVLPLLSAGDVGGLPYYTTPFVEGETLRTRLARVGALPLADAVRLLRELADALAYAHAQGVVHRDLKPENVLLSGGHAVVADFGVAKALSSATQEGAPAATSAASSTALGVAVGTPAYMAPEQIAADPAADHRVDLYALGVVAYELLAGAHPFAGRSPHAMMAAHLTEAPAPLTARRPELPPALSALVMRLLAKDPVVRPESAAAVAAAIDALSVAPPAPATSLPAAPAPDRAGHRRRWAAAAGVAVLAVVGVAAAVRARAAGERDARPPSGVVVADFEDRAGDSALAQTVAQALRIDLARSPRVTVPNATEVREGLAAMRADTTGALTNELALALARRTGGTAVLDGAVHTAGSGYVLTAQLVAAADGRPVATFRESAVDSSQVITAIDRLSRAVRAEIGESVASLRASPPLAVATTRSLPALAAYTRMADAQLAAEWPAALDYGRQAVALDPEFAEAWRRIGNVLGSLRIHRAEQVAAISRAYALRARLSRFEQGAAEASYYSSVLGDPRRAAERLNALAAEFPVSRDPRRPEANGNLAVTYEALGEWDLALRALQPVADSGRLAWLGQARYVRVLLAVGRLAAADSAARAFARDTSGLSAPFLRSWLAMARRDYAEALAQVDSALAYADSALPRAAWASGRVQVLRAQQRAAAATLGKLDVAARASAAHAREYERVGARPEALRTSAELALLEASLGLSDRAARRLDSSLARYPLAPMAALDRPYPALAAAWAAAGHPDRAEALLAEWARAVPTENQPLDAIPILRARILTRLAQGRAADAERLAREGRFGPCDPCRDAFLARAFDLRGAADSTVAAYERYLAVATAGRQLIDPTELARAYKRLGELYEERGDVQRAVQRYGDFVGLWQGADAALRPAVEDVRQRIRRLQARAG